MHYSPQSQLLYLPIVKVMNYRVILKLILISQNNKVIQRENTTIFWNLYERKKCPRGEDLMTTSTSLCLEKESANYHNDLWYSTIKLST